jgi:predicted transcriptional regulator
MTDNIIRITIRVREDLFMKMKLLAAARDTTLTEVLNEAIEEYIRSHEEEIKKRISEVMK